MATNDTETFTQLEKQYWQAIKDGDMPTLLTLTGDPCLVAGAQGTSIVDHETYKKMYAGAKWKLLDFSISDVHVLRAADNVVFVGYKVREAMDVEGKPVTLEAADTSVWIEQNGQWVCSLHTESVQGDPYGRDRAQK